MGRMIALILAAFTLASCVTLEQEAAQVVARMTAQCRSLGAGPETDNYDRCLMVLWQQEERAAANAALLGEGIGSIAGGAFRLSR
jgi:hypothetical protein